MNQMPVVANNTQNSLTITCAKGLEKLLADEMVALGIHVEHLQVGSIACQADLGQAYSCCLYSRIASRVLWQVKRSVVTYAEVGNYRPLYAAALEVPWFKWFAADKKFRVLVDVVGIDEINTQQLSFTLMDAIRDAFQQADVGRPQAAKDDAEVFVHLYWEKEQAVFSVDLAGQPLHQRGYRVAQAQAPIKENLAAAMLYWAGWSEQSYSALIDPFCGSGTLLIEAALIYYRIAPGSLGRHFALENYLFFVSDCWQRLLTEARQQRLAQDQQPQIPIRGYDANPQAIKAALENLRTAGLSQLVHVERQALANFVLPKSMQQLSTGLLITNAPYGERIEKGDSVLPLYQALGRIMMAQIPDWRVAVLSNQIEYLDKAGIASAPGQRFYNGPIRCYFRCSSWQKNSLPRVQNALQITAVEVPAEAEDFANRLRKNWKSLRKWVTQNQLSCFRLYDADMPEFNLAIDWYDGEFHVQEYQAPKSVAVEKAQQRLEWALQTLVKLFDIPAKSIWVKGRRKQKGKQQYRKLADKNRQRIVHENGAWLLVNLQDYLDTGLFLDHRPVRHWIQQQAQGKCFLNLFSYTGAASVHAAVGGASKTLSVDLSNTYLQWCRANLQLNGFAEEQHQLVQANCIQWLQSSSEQFDLIFMDPPTFSNSKRMQGVLDIQRDHAELIQLAMKRLAPDGLLIFSCNYRRFKLDASIAKAYLVKDVTKVSIPKDFERSQHIHQCFEIRAQQNPPSDKQ